MEYMLHIYNFYRLYNEENAEKCPSDTLQLTCFIGAPTVGAQRTNFFLG